jgi:hypothetical protein
VSASPDPTVDIERAGGHAAPRSRRALLGAGLGAVAATIASALGRPSPAAGAAGSSLVVGSQTNNAGTADTQLIASSNVIAFKLLQQGPGTALMGHATQTSGATRGVYGRTDSPAGYGVQGRAGGAAGAGAAMQAIGVNNTGLDASSSNGARYGIKVVNSSPTGTALQAEASKAIVGLSNGAGYPAIYGANSATTGQSYGVFGRTDADSEFAAGVGGESTNSAHGSGVYGLSIGDGGIGVWGVATGLSGIGVRGESGYDNPNAHGVYGRAMTGYGLASVGDTYVAGDLFVTGAKTGFVVDLAVNGGPATLRQGDPVTLIGVRAPLMGNIPLLEVAPAKHGDAVIGVMDRRVTVIAATLDDGLGNHMKGAGPAAASGEHLSVVTLGAFAVASADAIDGAIAPGTRLAAGKNGKLVKAKAVDVGGRKLFPAGENVGYSLGSLASGSGKVAIFVNPH